MDQEDSNTMTNEKHKHTIFLTDEVWTEIQDAYHADGCTKLSEFVEKAVRFYLGYLKAKVATAYLPRVLAEALDGKLGALGSRIGGVLFKLAVNDDMLTHVLAAGADVDPNVLDKLRVQCVNETKETHGKIDFRDALAFQQGL